MGDIETEEPGQSTWPHKLSVPGRIDATDTDLKMVIMCLNREEGLTTRADVPGLTGLSGER